MNTIQVRIGDLAEAKVAAVVRAVRSDGEAITAVGRRLELVAGPAVTQRMQALGDLPVGGAVITPGGELPADFIVHAVLQSAEEPVTAHTVQRALVNALRRAHDFGLTSVALPPLGTGAGNLDAEDAAQLIVDVIRDHLGSPGEPRSFEIVVESSYEQELYERAVSSDDLAEDVL